MFDIFNSDPFKLVPLGDAINKIAFVPGRINELGIFDAAGTESVDLAIEEKESIVTLVPRTPRGGPGTTVPKQGRVMRKIGIPHQQVDDGIMAEECQGVRSFGTEGQLQFFMEKVTERAGEHTQNFAATEEYARLGAIKGVIHYPDSGADIDLFAEFGVTQEAEVAFNVVSLTDGAFRKKCAGIKRTISKNMKGLPWTGKMRVFCGDNFFDDVLGNAEVRESYKNWNDAQILREGYIESNGKSFGAFEFADMIFENYRGADGDTPWVASDACHIFPEAAKGILFRTRYAPADYIETINTKGLRMYMKPVPLLNDKGVTLEVQTNAIHYCRLPKVLMKGKRGA